MKDEILKFFKGDAEDGAETLTKYSHDASLLEVRPKLVLFPRDSADVQNLVKWVSENCVRQDLTQKYGKISITARSAGTDMSGGAIGESIILDFTRYMNKLVAFPPSPLPGEGWGEVGLKTSPQSSPERGGGNQITVQPGMFYRDFEKLTLAKGLILPCYTASKSINAMGGMFGNNSAGERTLKYGKTENYVLESKVVFADGVERTIKPFPLSEIGSHEEIYKKVYELIKNNQEIIEEAKPNVHKNSAGYYLWNVIEKINQKNFSPLLHPTDGTFRLQNSSDLFFDLNKLLVGSQGTLGIATEITFRLVKDFKYSKLVVIFMKDLAPLGRLVDEILTQNPETLETYDDKTMKLAVRFFPDFVKNKGFFGTIKMMWNFLPEAFMMLSGGLPKLIILAEFAGADEEEANAKCRKLVEKISAKGGPALGWKDIRVRITKSQAESEKYWDIRRESFALLRKHVKNMRTAPFIDDIIVRPEFLPKFLPELNAILKEYEKSITFTLAGHAGEGNFHIIPLMDFHRPDTAKIILELGEKVYDLVMKYHGSITAEHNDGLIRTPYLEKMYGRKMVEIFAQVKKIFDPQDILNPGKKVPTENQGGTKAYISAHIAEEHDATHAV